MQRDGERLREQVTAERCREERRRKTQKRRSQTQEMQRRQRRRDTGRDAEISKKTQKHAETQDDSDQSRHRET